MMPSVLLLIAGLNAMFSWQTPGEDKIVGRWISVEKNLLVQVYKENDEFKAKILWFDDNDDLSKPMNKRCDDQNPDPKLRNRKIIGMEVLHNLRYNQEANNWENGLIYDAVSGREWSSYAYFTDQGLLKVKGYWHFKFIGQSIAFKKYTDNQVLN